MNPAAPFQPSDLQELGEFLARAERVVPMHDIARGDTAPNVIGLRHDVDDNRGSLDTALRLAEWEFEHGYSSTYFLLHGSHYWGEDAFVAAERFEELGHEVGLHVNVIAEALRSGDDPRLILRESLSELRTAAKVRGVVAHGDGLCHDVGFVNDEVFVESPRPACGDPRRILVSDGRKLRLSPVPRGDFGIEYDANWLTRGDYLSDSGGKWSQPFGEVADVWPAKGQLHMLVHSDWWSEAFVEVAV